MQAWRLFICKQKLKFFIINCTSDEYIVESKVMGRRQLSFPVFYKYFGDCKNNQVFEEGKLLSLSIEKKYREDKDFWDVKITGEVDIYTSDKIRDTLNEMIKEKISEIQIDCKELSYIDSSGLGVFIGILKKLKEEDKNLVVLNARSNILKLLSITGLDKVFVVREN